MKISGQIQLTSHFSFRYHWLLQILALICLAVFMALGLWQLNRAELKANMEQEYLDFLASEVDAISIQELFALSGGNALETESQIEQMKNYTLVKVKGRYDFDRQILRDNRFHGNTVGFFVFTPFLIEGTDLAILVNRGWLPAEMVRDSIKGQIAPEPDLLNQSLTIEGLIFKSLDRIELAPYPIDGFPVIVQNLDYDLLAKVTDMNFIKTTLRLSPDQKGGYVREWRFETNTSKEKHQAYALQWFSFALVVFSILLIKSFVYHKTQSSN